MLRQPEAGFGAPLDEWLHEDLGEMVGDLLSEESVKHSGYFDPKAVDEMVREHREGKCNWSMQIWQLLTFELWMQIFLRHKAPPLVEQLPATV